MQQPGGNSISQQNTKAGARSSRLVRPPFISRSAELDQLTTYLGRASRGQGQALFLAGEAGIGKTRLAHEALIYAREKGFLVLEGSSYALEDCLAYAPILAAFGPFLRRLEPPHPLSPTLFRGIRNVRRNATPCSSCGKVKSISTRQDGEPGARCLRARADPGEKYFCRDGLPDQSADVAHYGCRLLPNARPTTWPETVPAATDPDAADR